MIDLHCHILPGIDDGAQNLSDSLLMARAAVADGIHTIVATPHYQKNVYENNKQKILTRVEELNDALKAEGIDLTILAGQEPRIDGDLLANMSRGEVIALAGSSYQFVEFPSAHVPRYTEKLFYDLQQNGVIPIIVHPERNQEMIEHPDILYRLIKNGALSQVTASSVCGYFGKKIKRFTLQLIEANLTHFIASDAHNITSRTFKMTEAFDLIKSKFGEDLSFLFKENAELLVENKNVYKEIPERIQKKKFFNLF